MNTQNPLSSGEAHDAGVWLTRRQVAELTGKNIDTLRRWQCNLKLATRQHLTTGEVMLSAAELCKHGLIDPAQATLPEQSIARSRAERDLADARRQLAQLEAITERLADEVAFLRSVVGPKTGRAA